MNIWGQSQNIHYLLYLIRSGERMNRFNIKGSKHAGSMTGSMLRRFFWGLGAAVLTYVVVPKMRRMAKPAIEKGVSSVKELAERGRQTIEEYRAQKEDAVDMIKDASMEQVEVQKDAISGKINALQETIDRLKNEIMELRNKL